MADEAESNTATSPKPDADEQSQQPEPTGIHSNLLIIYHIISDHIPAAAGFTKYPKIVQRLSHDRYKSIESSTCCNRFGKRHDTTDFCLRQLVTDLLRRNSIAMLLFKLLFLNIVVETSAICHGD